MWLSFFSDSFNLLLMKFMFCRSDSKPTLPAQKAKRMVKPKMSITRYLLYSGLKDAILSIHENLSATCVACSFLPAIKCGRNINEQSEAPIKLNAAKSPRSFSISDSTNCRHKKPPTVVKLPTVMGMARSRISSSILRVCR